MFSETTQERGKKQCICSNIYGLLSIFLGVRGNKYPLKPRIFGGHGPVRGNGGAHRKVGGGEGEEQGRGFQEEPVTIGKIFRETSVKCNSAARPKQRRTRGAAMAVRRWPAWCMACLHSSAADAEGAERSNGGRRGEWWRREGFPGLCKTLGLHYYQRSQLVFSKP